MERRWRRDIRDEVSQAGLTGPAMADLVHGPTAQYALGTGILVVELCQALGGEGKGGQRLVLPSFT